MKQSLKVMLLTVAVPIDPIVRPTPLAVILSNNIFSEFPYNYQDVKMKDSTDLTLTAIESSWSQTVQSWIQTFLPLTSKPSVLNAVRSMMP